MNRRPVPELDSIQLTSRQLQLFGIIVQLAHEDRPITFAVLMEKMKIDAVGSISAMLGILTRHGLITRTRRKANTIRPAYRIELFAESWVLRGRRSSQKGT